MLLYAYSTAPRVRSPAPGSIVALSTQSLKYPTPLTHVKRKRTNCKLLPRPSVATLTSRSTRAFISEILVILIGCNILLEVRLNHCHVMIADKIEKPDANDFI